MNSEVQINPEAELVRTFPEFTKKIPALMASDQNFREIAEDWFLCKKTLKILEPQSQKKLLITEYTEALQALEEELIMHLTASTLSDFAQRPGKQGD